MTRANLQDQIDALALLVQHMAQLLEFDVPFTCEALQAWSLVCAAQMRKHASAPPPMARELERLATQLWGNLPDDDFPPSVVREATVAISRAAGW
jgi:hypothetical protein